MFLLLLLFVLLFIRLETENRQLNQIVSQLRNARKTSQESADTALADKQTFIQTIENQKKELINLRDKLSNYDIIVEEHTQFRNEVIIVIIFTYI